MHLHWSNYWVLSLPPWSYDFYQCGDFTPVPFIFYAPFVIALIVVIIYVYHPWERFIILSTSLSGVYNACWRSIFPACSTSCPLLDGTCQAMVGVNDVSLVGNSGPVVVKRRYFFFISRRNITLAKTWYMDAHQTTGITAALPVSISLGGFIVEELELWI